MFFNSYVWFGEFDLTYVSRLSKGLAYLLLSAAALTVSGSRAAEANGRPEMPSQGADFGTPPSQAGGTSPTRANSYDYISSATIGSVSPLPLRAGQPLTVRAMVTPSSPTSASALQIQLEVLVNGALAEKIDPLSASASVSGSGPTSGESSVVAPRSTLDSGPIEIVFLVRAPTNLTDSLTTTVALFSREDRRVVATQDLTPGLTPGPIWTGSPVLLAALGLLAFTTAGLAGLSVIGRMSRSKLEAEVQKSKVRVEEVQRSLASNGADEDKAREGQEESTVPRLPDYIVKAARDRRLALVLGAGVSAQAGLPASMSLWLSVLSRVQRQASQSEASDAEIDLLRKAVLRSGPYRVLDAIVAQVGRQPVIQSLRSELLVEGKVVSPVHEALARLDCQVIIDMTWDWLAPSLFSRRGAAVFTPARFERLIPLLREGKQCVFKPLGDLNDADSVSLTSQDFRRSLSRAPEFERTMASVFSTHHVLFLGMGLPAIEEFLKTLPSYLETAHREHVAVISKSDVASMSLWQAGVGASYGVRLVPYVPSENYREFLTMVEQLADEATRPDNEGRTPQSSNVVSMQQPYLCKATLENIGVFEKLEVEFNEGWTVFLGDNGGGKSTILKAIALALAGSDERGVKAAQRLLRTGATSGSVTIELGSDRVTTKLTRDGRSVKVDSTFSPVEAGRSLVMAFPVLRGVSTVASSGPSFLQALNPSVDDIAPILVGVTDSRLDDLKQWLINTLVNSESDPNGREARMLETIRSLVTAMMPGEKVHLSRVDRATWTVIVETGDGEVDFDSLSQGMSSIFNWVGVVIRRLYDVYPSSSRPEHERALVLIDEIDAHLHPQWQRRLVNVTREKFPALQVIASTHSPLLVGAVNRDELRLVVRDHQSGRMQVERSAINLSGQKADDILTSSLFDLSTTRSPDAEATIRRYFELYETPASALSPTEEKEMSTLSEAVTALNYGSAQPAWIAAEEPKLVTDVTQLVAGLSPEQEDLLRSRLGGKEPPETPRAAENQGGLQ
jgi:energy-coupling factor transporter ATP-binding protein EcfA2